MSGFYAPTLPLVMARLATVWRQWPALAGVTIEDGPAVTGSQDPEVLAVGYAGPGRGSEDDAIGRFLNEGLGPRDRERYTVHNALAVLDGGSDFSAALGRATDLWREAYAAVYLDTTLGGLVLRASAADWSLTRFLTDRGAVVQILFDVAVDAYTRP